MEDELKFLPIKIIIFFPKLRFGMEATFRSIFSNELIELPTYTCSVMHSVTLMEILSFDSNIHIL